MKIHSITPHLLGPFSKPATLTLEPDVTVLTGPNDVGKSMLLRFIQLVCAGGTVAEDLVSSDRPVTPSQSWEVDSRVYCDVELITDREFDFGGGAKVKSGDIVTVRAKLAPRACSRNVTRVTVGDKSITSGAAFNEFPTCATVITPAPISNPIVLDSPNHLEQAFLQLAFGQPKPRDMLRAWQPHNREREVRKAANRVTEHFKHTLGASFPFRFDLLTVGNDVTHLAVYLEDSRLGHSLLGLRGAGIQKLVALLTSLQFAQIQPGNSVLVWDEPETSFHADLQHSVRSLLEALAADKSIQIVYATHSSAMINNLRPRSVRLLRAVVRDSAPAVEIEHRPFAENWTPVRASLGMSPSDSLLYATITLILEGKTDVLCVPEILLTLCRGKVEGFADVEQLLPECHVIDACGSSFAYYMTLSKSQGSHPIILLDGDRRKRVQELKLSELQPDVPCVFFEGQSEIEESVQRAVYFKALAEELAEPSATESSFDAWSQRNPRAARFAFSKRIERWIQDSWPDRTFDKVATMQAAVKRSSPSDINPKTFAELMTRIRDLLQRPSK